MMKSKKTTKRNKLVKAREKLGWSILEASKRTGIPQPTLTCIELGTRKGSLMAWLSIQHTYKLTRAEMIELYLENNKIENEGLNYGKAKEKK